MNLHQERVIQKLIENTYIYTKFVFLSKHPIHMTQLPKKQILKIQEQMIPFFKKMRNVPLLMLWSREVMVLLFCFSFLLRRTFFSYFFSSSASSSSTSTLAHDFFSNARLLPLLFGTKNPRKLLRCDQLWWAILRTRLRLRLTEKDRELPRLSESENG